jgi:hypothetical protein
MPADMLIEKPTSQFAEALRNARATIMGVKGELAPKIIALTSSCPAKARRRRRWPWRARWRSTVSAR